MAVNSSDCSDLLLCKSAVVALHVLRDIVFLFGKEKGGCSLFSRVQMTPPFFYMDSAVFCQTVAVDRKLEMNPSLCLIDSHHTISLFNNFKVVDCLC